MKSIFTLLSKIALLSSKNPKTLAFLFLLQFCCNFDISSQTTMEYKTSTDTLVVYSEVPGLNLPVAQQKYSIRVKSAATSGAWIAVFAHYTYNKAKELGGVTVPKTDGTLLNTTVYNYAKHTSDWSHTYGNIEISKNHPVEVEIATKAGFKVRNLDIFKATVHPAQKASAATISNGKIYFTISNPGQLVIDINGQMDDFNAAINGGIGGPVHAISLFVNPVIKKPTLTNPRTYYVEPTTTRAMLDNVAPATFDTIYYKPGVHDLGKDIKIYPGKVVYIPGDALIYGNMNNLGVPNGGFSKNGEKIRIYGYGTISGAKITHGDYVVNPTGSFKGFEIENGLNWKCEGIANVDSPNHSVYTIGGSNGLFNWVKVITWRANGDGIGGYEPALNCFIRTQDDCSYAKGYKKNCTFWKDANAALFHLSTISENTTEPIIIEDCDVIYARLRDAVGNTGGGFQQRAEGTGGQRNINVIFRNIRIHDKLTNMSIINLVSYQGSNANAPTVVGSSYKGFLFQNISIAGMAPNNKQRILGCSDAPWYGGLIFDNLTIGGVKVTKDNYQTYINTNEFVKYLLFKMPQNVTLTTIADSIKGSISRDPDQSTYLETSTVTLSAIGKAGYIFSNWTGDITGTTNPINVVVDKNMTITANFIPFDFTSPYTGAADKEPDVAGLSSVQKIFGGLAHPNMGWCTTLDYLGHIKKKPRYVIKAGETYKIIFSGRAQRFNVDYFVIYNESVFTQEQAQLLSPKGKLAFGANISDQAKTDSNCWTKRFSDARDLSKTNVNLAQGIVDANRKAFQINMVKEPHNEWAITKNIFDGDTGKYNILFSSILETDGECFYRVLVDGKVVLEYQNPRILGTDKKDYSIYTVGVKELKITKGALV